MSVLAIIPARGGSKRLPGKNIRSFAGKPLLWYSIAFAQRSKLIDHVVVSTDDREISEVAERFGAQVILRPAELSTDHATTGQAMKHAFEGFNAHSSVSAVITLQPTNPLRKEQDLELMFALFKGNDSVISVSPLKKKPGIIADGFYKPEQKPGGRSQDLAARYFENGNLYISSPSVVMNEDVFGEKIKAHVMEGFYGHCDIDDIDDFEVAESYYLAHKNRFNLD